MKGGLTLYPETKISSRQAAWLVISIITATAILFVPAIVAEDARHDGWMSTLIATVGGIVLILIPMALALRFPKETMIQYTPRILGQILGIPLILFYLFFLFWAESVILREFSTFLITAIMPDTPLVVFIASLSFTAALAVRGGLEVIARSNQFVLPIAIVSFVTSLALSINNMNLDRILPLFDHFPSGVLRGSYTPFSWMTEAALMLMFFPEINRQAQARKAAVVGIALSGLILTAAVLVSLLVLGPHLAAAKIAPTFSMVRMISVGDFIERTDAIMVIVWIGGVFVKISAFTYVKLLGLAQWLGLSDYRPLVWPNVIFSTALAVLVFDNTPEMLHTLSKSAPAFLITINIVLPAILLGFSYLRGKRGAGKS